MGGGGEVGDGRERRMRGSRGSLMVDRSGRIEWIGGTRGGVGERRTYQLDYDSEGSIFHQTCSPLTPFPPNQRVHP